VKPPKQFYTAQRMVVPKKKKKKKKKGKKKERKEGTMCFANFYLIFVSSN
jgi:hypothetical protein